MNCKSYIPGYYSMRDLNEDTGNSWPIYYDNKALNGNVYNGCMFSSLNGYSEYDKEMLKRTMLEHEAIFRKQVYELHRLYRIQKNLMDELQKTGLYRFSTWTVKSKTSLSLSEAETQVAGRIWQLCHQSALSSSQSRETTTITNTNVSPISTRGSCFNRLENGAPERDGDESNDRIRASSTKRMLDLQVPAEVYIDIERTERSEKEEVTGLSSVIASPYSIQCNRYLENEVKLNLTNVSSTNGDVHQYDSHSKCNIFHLLADLNEPIEESSLAKMAFSFPSQSHGPETQLDENQRTKGSTGYVNLWQQISSSKKQGCDENDSLSVFSGTKDLSPVCYQYHGKAENSKIDLNLHSDEEKCSLSFEPIQSGLIKTSDILLNDINKPGALFGQKKGSSLEVSKNSNLAVLDNPKKLVPAFPHSSTAASSNIDASTLPLFRTWMKPSDSEKPPSAPFQTISSFNKSTTMNSFRILDSPSDGPNGLSDRWQFCRDYRSLHVENGEFSVSHQVSPSLLQLNVSYIGLNLNSRESCHFDSQDRVTAPKNVATREMEGECEVMSSELSFLRPTCNETLSLNSASLSFRSSALRNEGIEEIKADFSSCNLEEFPSNLHCSEEKAQRNENPDCLSRDMIIRLPIVDDKIYPNPNLVIERQQQVDGLQHDMEFCGINPLNTQKELYDENCKSSMHHIDLNCEMASMEESNLPQMLLPECPASLPSQTLDTISSSKPFPLIDNEAPVFPNEEIKVPEIESIPCSVEQNECSYDLLIKEAAENMITLSFDNQSFLAAEPSCNIATLHWFVDVVLLNSSSKDTDAEIDLFELMTLQLQESKPEEWLSPQEAENAKEDAKSRPTLLYKRLRRGPARKRRQRRDFQKDTLPGLATLSRQEVVEDLQLIGGLMKASGKHWEAGAGRRNTQAKAKRRLLQRKTVITASKEQSRPQQTLFLFSKNGINPEFEIEWPGMVCWGRTTRRCRRSRCHPPQSVATALS